MAIKDLFNRKTANDNNTVNVTRQTSKVIDASEEKASFDWANLSDTLQSLDINNVADWPVFAKVGAAIMVAILVNAVVFAVLTNSVRSSIDTAQVEETRLLQTYRELDSKVRTLSRYEQQYSAMEAEFNQLLDKLPRQINVPDLIEEINVAGMRSGIRFSSITVKPDVVKDNTIELPIDMVAVGDYHGFGAFASEIANLSRIITLHDFDIKSQTSDNKSGKSGIPVLTLQVQAKTYRYNDNPPPTDKDKATNPQGAE